MGDVLTARVQYKSEHGDIGFMLCDDNSCSTLSVGGAAPDGALWAVAYINCNQQGWWGCITHYEVGFQLARF